MTLRQSIPVSGELGKTLADWPVRSFGMVVSLDQICKRMRNCGDVKREKAQQICAWRARLGRAEPVRSTEYLGVESVL